MLKDGNPLFNRNQGKYIKDLIPIVNAGLCNDLCQCLHLSSSAAAAASLHHHHRHQRQIRHY